MMQLVLKNEPDMDLKNQEFLAVVIILGSTRRVDR
jgi:hypothetical protein